MTIEKYKIGSEYNLPDKTGRYYYSGKGCELGEINYSRATRTFARLSPDNDGTIAYWSTEPFDASKVPSCDDSDLGITIPNGEFQRGKIKI